MAPQLIAPMLLVTVPVPLPFLETVSVCWSSVNVAVTLRAWSIVTLQAPVPLQSPLQPVKVEFKPTLAVRSTEVPCANVSPHVPGQLIAPGLEVTRPLPFPAGVTVSSRCARSNCAFTVCAASIGTVQSPVSEQVGQSQPMNADVGSGAACRTTDVPWLKSNAHVAPQSTPKEGERLVTVPVPVPPFLVTVSSRRMGS